jgi:hypothetical protein
VTRAALLALAACAACDKGASEPRTSTTPTADAPRGDGSGAAASGGTPSGGGNGAVTVVDASPATFALPADCAGPIDGLFAAIQQQQRAMAANTKGETAWHALRAECRGGAWYAAAAMLLRVGAKAPLVEGDVSLTSPRDAFERGLAVEKAPRLLAYASFVAGVAPDAAPPFDVAWCDALTGAGTPEEAYVCAHAELAAGVAAAEEAFATIKEPLYPDVPVRHVQAVASGDRARAKKLVAKAKGAIDRWSQRAGVVDRDVETLRQQLDAAVR